MRKRVIRDYDLRTGTLLSANARARVVKLKNGDVLKIFNPMILNLMKMSGIDMERKILAAKPIKNSPEILVPTSAVYTVRDNFIGYTTTQANGVDYNTYESGLTIEDRSDLEMYAKNHSKLESVLSRNSDIVFPDFCTCDNIFLDRKGRVQFIDYDGIQVGEHKSMSISTSLGASKDYFENLKYCTTDGYFTKELDKKSSLVLYFLTAFNADLGKVGTINRFTGKLITLEDVFSCVNLDDPDLCHKAWKLFQDDQQNDFLGDTVYDIADKYDLHVVGQFERCYLKRLTKKR